MAEEQKFEYPYVDCAQLGQHSESINIQPMVPYYAEEKARERANAFAAQALMRITAEPQEDEPDE